LSKKLRTALPVFVSTLLLASGAQAAEGDWELVRDSNGIQIFTRTVEGSSLVELKAITIIDSNMKTIIEVLRDVTAYPEWQKSCREAKILKRLGADDFIIHVMLSLPVVSDRDAVIKSQAEADMDRARMHINFNKIEMPEVPSPKGMVRMAEFSGQFLLEYISRDKTGVIYRYKADPGTGIPSFMVNMFGKNVLYKTISAFREMTTRSRYKEAAVRSLYKTVIDGVLGDNAKVREILRRRLKEQLGDSGAVDRMMQDDQLVNRFIDGDDQLTSLIFLAFGTYDAKKLAAGQILKILLKKNTKDEKLIEKIASDKDVLKAIITGEKVDDKSSAELIDGYLKTAEAPAEPPAEKPVEKPAEKQTDRQADKKAEAPVEPVKK
jgi:hypothetical protein